MPNVDRIFSPFLQGGNPDTVNAAIPTAQPQAGTFLPYAPGDLGASFDYQDKTYTVVLVDSGATSANPVGTVTPGQVLFWKDKSARIVTNDKKQTIGVTESGARNFAAGIARVAVGTPGAGGNLICMLTRGANISCASDGTGVAGSHAIVDDDVNTARVVGVSLGTAPAHVPVGLQRGAPSGGFVNVDVDIPTLP